MSDGVISTAEDLRAAIERAGYYPELVAEALATALADEPVVSWLVQHEATFDRDELRRHVTVLALTPTRLVVGHTDDHPADDVVPVASATTSTEAVPLRQVGSVVVSRTLLDPVRYRRGAAPSDVVLTIGWGAVSRLDLEPASCGDPECDADHGYTGTASADDLSVRVSGEGDGKAAVAQALRFAAALSAATARTA
ncbi:MAG: DUF5998 family protein [Actinomycetia bacterium]|jgi:hypothetical protein|nr:DUF5998 family protein [Actinomycetes bacterium]